MVEADTIAMFKRDMHLAHIPLNLWIWMDLRDMSQTQVNGTASGQHSGRHGQNGPRGQYLCSITILVKQVQLHYNQIFRYSAGWHCGLWEGYSMTSERLRQSKRIAKYHTNKAAHLYRKYYRVTCTSVDVQRDLDILVHWTMKVNVGRPGNEGQLVRKTLLQYMIWSHLK